MIYNNIKAHWVYLRRNGEAASAGPPSGQRVLVRRVIEELLEDATKRMKLTQAPYDCVGP